EAAQAAQATGQGETLDLPDATVEASQEDDPPADSGCIPVLVCGFLLSFCRCKSKFTLRQITIRKS
ncbi:MAG: hypothetical protein IKD26_01885, partial [Clostridia bacterium]|nr:hypothetical protein [Clostridia bacterium]